VSRDVEAPGPEITGPCVLVGPSVMYPEDGNYGPAREVCMACPARTPCLEHALAVREDDGMWGGLTPPERRRIARRRREDRATGQGLLDVGTL